MVIEKGDYFVIIRGKRIVLPPAPNFISQPPSASSEGDFSFPVNAQEVFCYDRIFDGCVFKALEVCGEMAASQLVFPQPRDPAMLTRFSMNLAEMEIWTVSQRYLDALLVKPDPEERYDQSFLPNNEENEKSVDNGDEF